MKIVFLFAGIFLFANGSHSIVLHSSADIANEILQLKQDVAAIKQENSAIKQENMQLKAKMKGKQKYIVTGFK